MKAMVLAAGFGNRLRPLSSRLPKPLFPFMGRPIVEHTLSLLKSAGIDEAVINLHHLGGKVEAYLGDGSRFGTRLRYSREDPILGSAGGVKAAQKYLDGDAFIVINSDVVTDIDLKKLLRFHRKNKSCLTLALTPALSSGKADPIAVDEQGRVTHFSQELSAQARKFIFTGVQVMGPEIFDRIPPDVFMGTTDEVFPQMVAEGLPVFGFVHDGYWADIGNRADYLATHRDCMDGKVKSIRPGAADTPAGANIRQPALIGEGCHISANASVGPYTVLGDGCRVEDNAVVANSVCWDGAVIEEGAVVTECIVGNDCHISAGKKLFREMVVAEE